MSANTSIEWTDRTWNPVDGCTKISPGCVHCYIERTPPFRMHGRKFVDGHIPVVLHPERIEQPLHWRKPSRIFVNSLSDLFHEDVPDSFIAEVFWAMACARQHTFQVLTKRPQRMSAFLSIKEHLFDATQYKWAPSVWPLPNVWLGVSVENQHFADERIPLLLQTPAAVRFLSCEPLLEPVDLGKRCDWYPPAVRFTWLDELDWVICGGESGPGTRPMQPEWARSLRDQCQRAGVHFFFKQWGEFVPCDQVSTEELIGDSRHGRKQPVKTCGYFCCREHGHIEHGDLITLRVGKKKAGRLLDGRTWDEFPQSVAQ